MVKITEHFTLEEMVASNTAVRNGIDNTPNAKVKACLTTLCKDVLEPLRMAYGKPIRVSSGYRSPKLNKAVGGAATSQHVYGQAADITCMDKTASGNKELFNTALSLMNKGIIKVGQLIDEYNYSWVHISTPASHTNQVLHIR